MTKHAYLIIAHGEEPVLRVLLGMLDDERNDVYLHVDRKSEALYRRISSYQMKRASLFVLRNRISTYWGHLSLVKVEYLLFRTAYSYNADYAYFHLLSGVDLPIKSQNQIHDFFEAHRGAEFVDMWNAKSHYRELNCRISKYYFFLKWKKGGNVWVHGITSIMRNGMLGLQKVTGFQRKKDVTFKKGSQWVSVTSDFVRYLLERERWVMHRFNRTLCPDEIFIQTIIWNSGFREKLYDNGKNKREGIRKIDWLRGSPYVWRKEDLEELLASEALFARKFSSKDLAVIEAIRQAAH